MNKLLIFLISLFLIPTYGQTTDEKESLLIENMCNHFKEHPESSYDENINDALDTYLLPYMESFPGFDDFTQDEIMGFAEDIIFKLLINCQEMIAYDMPGLEVIEDEVVYGDTPLQSKLTRKQFDNFKKTKNFYYLSSDKFEETGEKSWITIENSGTRWIESEEVILQDVEVVWKEDNKYILKMNAEENSFERRIIEHFGYPEFEVIEFGGDHYWVQCFYPLHKKYVRIKLHTQL